jgi:hypothetical protein
LSLDSFPPIHASALLQRIFSLLLLAVSGVQAQFTVDIKATNALHGKAPYQSVPAGISTPQFSAVGFTAGASSAISNNNDPLRQFPAALTADNKALLQLRSSQFGHPVMSGPPRYSLGDVISPPMVKVDGALLTSADEAAAYWRMIPVAIDEPFSQPDGPEKPWPWKPEDLMKKEKPSAYWSPHAKKVFATQAGAVKLMWVTALPQAVPEALPGTPPRFQFKTEEFTVAPTTKLPVRTMFWTERGFNCPPIQFNGGQIQAINPVWSTNFPSNVDETYQAPGSQPTPGEPEEKRTLWPDVINGLGNLRCYNHEGRIFVEYLGEVLSPGVHRWLGADVIEVRQVMNPSFGYTLLGEALQPPDQDPRLIPSLVSNFSGVPYTASVTAADGGIRYFAERENQSPDNVVVYWLDPQDAGIYSPASPDSPTTPGLSLKWPKYQSKYRFVWPEDSGVATLPGNSKPLLKYEHVTVPKGGSTEETGVQFDPASIPSVVFQDSGGNARINGETSQRLVVTIPGAGIPSRSLLKFTNAAGDPWYVRIYTQDSSRTDFKEGDVAQKLTATVKIGSRINAPAGYAVAGYLASGRCHNPGAYKDPFLEGVEPAAAGSGFFPVKLLERIGAG